MSARILFVRVVATVPDVGRRYVQCPIESAPGVKASMEARFGKPWLVGLVADMVTGLGDRLQAAGVDLATVEWCGRMDVAYLCGGRR